MIWQPAEVDTVRFLETLFEPDDAVTVRPIETWEKNGKKRSRVVNKGLGGVSTMRLNARNLQPLAKVLNERAAKERANLFFGTCPRFGALEWAYDYAWQIRTVRCLWSDIDGCSVEGALQRIAEAELPSPSIVASSGNGGHFHWLLDHPQAKPLTGRHLQRQRGRLSLRGAAG